MDFTRVVNPGTDRGAMINSAIRAAALRYVSTGRKQVVELGAGVHYVEQKIVGRSGVSLQGAGQDRTVLVPTFGAVADADSVASCVIGVEGELDAAMNTTLTAIAPYNTESVAVAAAGTIAAGKYFLIQGRNDVYPQNSISDSDGVDVVLSEVCQVAAGYAAGLTLPLAWSLRQHHTTNGITVRGLVPVIGFEVKNLSIRGSEDGVTTSVGIFGRYVLDLVVENVAVSGCSRFAVDLVGVLGFSIGGFRSLGTNNGWIQLTSCQDGEVHTFRGARGTASVHASGTPRFPILLRQRCTGVTVRDGVLEGTALGMYLAGGKHIVFHNLLIRDVEITQAIYDRCVLGGEIQNGGAAVLGWGSGYGPLNIAEFAHDVQVSNVRTENLRGPATAGWTDNPYRAVAYLFHDVLAMVASDVSAINRGISGGTTAVAGVIVSDAGIVMVNLFISGHSFGLITQNVSTGLRLTNYVYEATPGSGGNSTIPIYFDHGAGDHEIRIKGVRFSNAFSQIRFGGSFVFDEKLVIEDLMTDAGEWDYVILADNQTGGAFATGDIVEFDGTYQGANRRIKTPDAGGAGYERRLASVVSGTGTGGDVGTGIQAVAPMPQRRASVMATTAVVERGDVLEYAAALRVAADNAAAVPLGTARNRKAAGAEGMILIGSVA